LWDDYKTPKIIITTYAPKERKRKKDVKAVGHFFSVCRLCGWVVRVCVWAKKMNTPEGLGLDRLLERAIFA
jgi:hypothetical protein